MKTSSKIWMCLAGIALVALGVLCIMYPGETLLSLAWLFGLIFFVGGCTQMAAWASTRWFMPRSGLMFFSALLEILLGCLMVFHPAPVMLALPFTIITNAIAGIYQSDSPQSPNSKSPITSPEHPAISKERLTL